MGNTGFGEIEWGQDVNSNSDPSKSKDLWLKLVEGSNELRIVTKPHQYTVHQFKPEGSTGFGTKIKCSKVPGDPSSKCAMCDYAAQFEHTDKDKFNFSKAKKRFMLGVIDRTSKKYKVLDVSAGVLGDINKLAKNVQRWGDPSKYDIDIIVDKKAPPTGYYTVQPVGKEPLSAEDQKLKDSANLDELKKFTTPIDSDLVLKLMEKEMERVNAALGGKAPAKAPVRAPQKVASTPVVDDGLDDFPPFNE